MQKRLVGFLVALALTGMALAAERLKEISEAESLEETANSGGELINCVYPVYPAEKGATWTEERVLVAFVVDATGRVTDVEARSGPERFRGPAVAAVKQWQFRPRLKKGQPVPVAYHLSIPFKPTGTPPRSIRADWETAQIIAAPVQPPGDPVNSDPLYPGFLAARRLSGEVELVLGLGESGRVEGVSVVRACHPDFLSAALDTVAAWECEPARQGPLPVPSQKRVVLTFFTTDEAGSNTQADWMEHAGIFLREPTNTKVVDYFDQPVEALRMVDPVYPLALARAGTRGGARVDFRIDAFGRVGDIRVAEATEPDFGAAVAAAIAAWQFAPLQRKGETVSAEFSFTWKFAAPRAGSAEERLLAAEAAPAVKSRELDRPLFPLFRRGAIFPAARLDARQGGRAEIEFIIDRDGRVRWPHIRGASEPEFGWAAATAVAQWLFETPRKNGQPVDVKVAIPLEFEAPAAPAQPEDAIKPPGAGQ